MNAKLIIGIPVFVVAAFAGFVATKPADFTIERSATLAAPPDVVFSFVNDFKKWPAWSPWEKLDPSMKKTLSGAEQGVGAVYEWESAQDNVGHGRMTIEESAAPSKIAIKLEFLKPWQANNPTVFAFAGDGASTKVTWTMRGTNNFMMKAMTMFMDMDAMVGKDFESGLKSLGEAASAEAKRLADEAAAAKAKAEAEAAALAAAQAAADAEAAAKKPGKK